MQNVIKKLMLDINNEYSKFKEFGNEYNAETIFESSLLFLAKRLEIIIYCLKYGVPKQEMEDEIRKNEKVLQFDFLFLIQKTLFFQNMKDFQFHLKFLNF